MLSIIANIGIWIIALLHIWFFILEFYFWKKPLGMRVFKLDKEFAQRSAALAANQGIYNAFLSAGLFWGLLSNTPIFALQIKIFFLCCVIVAGVAGGFLVNMRIILIQAFPAIATLVLLILAR